VDHEKRKVKTSTGPQLYRFSVLVLGIAASG
jgi:hypothetical protein